MGCVPSPGKVASGWGDCYLLACSMQCFETATGFKSRRLPNLRKRPCACSRRISFFLSLSLSFLTIVKFCFLAYSPGHVASGWGLLLATCYRWGWIVSPPLRLGTRSRGCQPWQQLPLLLATKFNPGINDFCEKMIFAILSWRKPRIWNHKRRSEIVKKVTWKQAKHRYFKRKCPKIFQNKIPKSI